VCVYTRRPTGLLLVGKWSVRPVKPPGYSRFVCTVVWGSPEEMRSVFLASGVCGRMCCVVWYAKVKLDRTSGRQPAYINRCAQSWLLWGRSSGPLTLATAATSGTRS
jgi:hypothetical protein